MFVQEMLPIPVLVLADPPGLETPPGLDPPGLETPVSGLKLMFLRTQVLRKGGIYRAPA